MLTDRCPTCGRKKERSSEQNRRYWKLVALLADKPVQGHNYSKESWHEYLKSRFLGSETLELPNQKSLVRTLDTHNLDVDAFNRYMHEVEAWAEEHGVWLDS